MSTLTPFTRSHALAVSSCALVLFGCPSMSTMNTARTLDAGEFRFIAAPGVSRVSLGAEPLVQPQVELGGRFGITDDVEVGAKLWVPGYSLDAKIALLRAPSKDSGMDLSINPGLSYIGGISGTRTGGGATLHVATVFLPVLIGFNTGGGDQLVLGPRLIDQLWLGSDDEGSTINLIYAGSSIGYAWKVSDSVMIMPELSVATLLVGTLTGFGTDVGTNTLWVQGGIAILLGGS